MERDSDGKVKYCFKIVCGDGESNEKEWQTMEYKCYYEIML